MSVWKDKLGIYFEHIAKLEVALEFSLYKDNKCLFSYWYEKNIHTI